MFLVSWGCTKFAVARLSGPVIQQFYRLNVPAVLGLVTLQLKGGRVGFLPMEAQAAPGPAGSELMPAPPAPALAPP